MEEYCVRELSVHVPMFRLAPAITRASSKHVRHTTAVSRANRTKMYYSKVARTALFRIPYFFPN